MIDHKVSQPFTKHSFLKNQTAFSESLHLHALPLANLLTWGTPSLANRRFACFVTNLRFVSARGKEIPHAHIHDLWRRASRRSRRKARQSKAHLISILLLGFLSGNLFGTVLSFLRGFIIWDLFIIATLLFIIELTGYITYNPRITRLADRRFACYPPFCAPCPCTEGARAKRGKSTGSPSCPKGAWQGALAPLRHARQSMQILDLQAHVTLSKIKAINFFKVGIMIGFFVDAFKVGS